MNHARSGRVALWQVLGALGALLGGIAAVFALFLNTPDEDGSPGGVQAASKPRIESFGVYPQQTTAAAGAQLSWGVSDATEVTISPGIGRVSGTGSRALQLTSTTQYTLTATNEAGSVQATCTLTIVTPGKLQVSVSQGSPTVAPGGKAALYVTVFDQNGARVAGADVLIEAGGGRFLSSGSEAYDPKERQHGPYSVGGKTDANGQFTAWWVCQPCAAGYGMSVKASKSGYEDGSGGVTVTIG